jgi:surfactin synthase thioesterase subunit
VTAARPASPWVVVAAPNPAARLRLFCFPYAGGGAAAYFGWGETLPRTVEVCAVQPPGRDARGFRHVMFPGGHFFQAENRDIVLEELSRELRHLLARTRLVRAYA